MEEHTETNYEFYCDTCNHGATRKSDFNKHLKSKKHEEGD